MQKIVYSIEGNIGSGKSVLLNLLAKRRGVVVAPEPVSDWQHVGNYNILQEYYRDPHRWAYSFQNYALLTRFKHLHAFVKETVPADHIMLSQRSVEADKEVFAKLLCRQEKMSEMEYQLYLNFYRDLSQLYSLPIRHRYIYLRTKPEKCLQRIHKRGRREEQSIDMDYLRSIHEIHEEWLTRKSSLIIEGTAQFQKDEHKINIVMEKIRQLNSKDAVFGGDYVSDVIQF